MLVYCLWMNKEEISVAMLRGALLPTLWFSASDVRFTVAANLVKFLYSDKKNHRYCLVPGFLRSSIFLLSAHLKTPLTNSVSHFGSVDEGLTSLKVIILKISNVLFFLFFSIIQLSGFHSKWLLWEEILELVATVGTVTWKVFPSWLD